MRVLLVTTAYPAHREDARGAHIVRMVTGLREAGHYVQVVAPAGGKRIEAGGEDFRVVTFWPGRAGLVEGVSGILPNLKARPWLVVQVPALLAAMFVAVYRSRGRFDVIHAQWILPTGFVCLVAARFRGKREPVVMTAHGGDVNPARRNWLWAMLLRMVARRADVCTTVSRDLRDILVRLGVSEDRVIVTPLGVDPTPGIESAKRRGFVFVGSLIPRKDVPTLLRAWQSAGVASSLVIVGDGPERDNLTSIASEMGIEVEFVGSLPPARALAYMEEAECLVLPSVTEGRPVVIMEMLARRGCVIAARIPGVVELLGSGWPGLFDPGDSDALASLIRRYHEDLSFGNDMRGAGEIVLRDLSTDIESSTLGFLAAYETAIESRCE